MESEGGRMRRGMDDWNASGVYVIWNYDSIYQKLFAVSGEWMNLRSAEEGTETLESWVPEKRDKMEEIEYLNSKLDRSGVCSVRTTLWTSSRDILLCMHK